MNISFLSLHINKSPEKHLFPKQNSQIFSKKKEKKNNIVALWIHSRTQKQTHKMTGAKKRNQDDVINHSFHHRTPYAANSKVQPSVKDCKALQILHLMLKTSVDCHPLDLFNSPNSQV